MARNVSLGWPVRRGRPPGKPLASLPLPYGPFIPDPSACACAASIPLASLLLGYKPLDFRPVLPPQPLQVQHTRPRLALVPRRGETPTNSLPPPPPHAPATAATTSSPAAATGWSGRSGSSSTPGTPPTRAAA